MDMRISNAIKAYGSYQPNKPASASKGGKSENKKDVVALSSQAKDFQSIHKMLAGVPDIRENLVTDLKSRIDNGTYFVSDKDVAGKIIESMGY